MSPFVEDSDFTLYVGDALDVLRGLPAESVHCVVTSPPYWGLRDYGTGAWDGGDLDCDHTRHVDYGTKNDTSAGAIRGGPFKDVCGKCGARRVDQQLGLEATPDAYVASMVEVFREVRRVLRRDGTCWLNLGDSYSTDGGRGAARMAELGRPSEGAITPAAARGTAPGFKTGAGLKAKDLVGIPWRVAFALQADGWYLRSDIIWSKPNPMPESVTDRPTKAHEYLFLLTRSPRYFYDADAIREPHTGPTFSGKAGINDAEYVPDTQGFRSGGKGFVMRHRDYNAAGRNRRSVWEIATQPYPEAHFATFPEALVEPCILAGCPEWVCGTCGKPRERLTESDSSWAERKANGAEQGSGWALGGPRDGRSGDQNTVHGKGMSHDLTPRSRSDLGWSDCGHGNYQPGVVLDPFLGSGTTAKVARRHGRRSIGIELSPEYARLAAKRLSQLSLLADFQAKETA